MQVKNDAFFALNLTWELMGAKYATCQLVLGNAD